jgi:hypothetical protein
MSMTSIRQVPQLWALILAIFAVGKPQLLTAQIGKEARIEHLVNAVINDIPNNLYDLPAGVQRVVLYEVESNIPKVYLRSEDLELQLTTKLTQMGIRVVFLPEFASKINLKIRSTDSTIVIDNRKPVSRLKSNPYEFNRVCLENNIQGLFRCFLHYDSVNGPKLSMSILHPSSKNLLWMKQIDLSKESIVKQTDFSFNFGLGFQNIREIRAAGGDTALTKDLIAVPYFVGLNYMQYLNPARNQQLGIGLKLRIVNQTPVVYNDVNLGPLSAAFIPSVGITYKAHFLKKKTVIPSYWMGFQLGLNYFNYNQSFMGLEQLVSFHVSNRMQLGLRLEQTLSEFDSYANEDQFEVKLDNINYALQISIHF